MPTYEYKCRSCEHEIEVMQKLDEPAIKHCPKCKKYSLKRLISPGSFILKGDGWAKDLYSPGGEKRRE